jgi:membrane peptidoglycan carboxypeptidase
MIGDLIKSGSSRPDDGGGSSSRRRRKKGFFSRTWVKVLVVSGFLLTCLAAIAFYFVAEHYRKEAENYDLSQMGVVEHSSLILDRNGEEIGSFFVSENRRPIAYGDIPQHFLDALIAEEDSRFWDHNGVDYMGPVPSLSSWPARLLACIGKKA